MPSIPPKKPTKKPGGLKMLPKVQRKFDAGDNDKMKAYGDEFDPRPRGRVIPDTVAMRARKRPKTV